MDFLYTKCYSMIRCSHAWARTFASRNNEVSIHYSPNAVKHIKIISIFMGTMIIYIYIYIWSGGPWQHGFPWLSWSNYQYHPTLLAGPPNNIHSPYRIYTSCCWSANTCTSMSRCLLKKHTYKCVLVSFAVSCMSFWDERYVAVKQQFCGLLFPGFVQNSMKHSLVNVLHP